jgi:hypothetical protein
LLFSSSFRTVELSSPEPEYFVDSESLQLPGKLLGRLRLGTLGTILGAALLAVGDADRIERSTHNVVANSREILDATAADEHDRVLLQVVADAWDVGRNFDPVREANARNLAEGRVWLLGGLGVDAGADATTLRRTLERRAGSLITSGRAALLDELMERRH